MTKKYKDRPMDFVDAILVITAKSGYILIREWFLIRQGKVSQETS
jgi:predicted nucleic acid-binding protein